MEEKKNNPLIDRLKRVVGAHVTELREERERTDGKFSQNDLAAALRKTGQKVQQGQIGHIESFRRLPSTELLYSLAEYFGTSLDFLTGRTKLQSSIAAIEEDLQTGGISGRLGEIYKSLPPERQAEVYQFAEALRTITLQEKYERGSVTLPTESQRRREHVQAMLESIERYFGQDVRVEVDKVLRDKGRFRHDDS